MWNDLTMSERADVIKMAVKAGLRDMQSIRKFYDDSLKYAEGGPKSNISYVDTVRMNDNGMFSDESGNIIGDSVILPEFEVTGVNPKNQFVQPNDNLWVDNGRIKNPELRNKGEQGAKSYALWEKEHPALTKWSYATAAAPFIVASAPLTMTAGDALAATSLGNAVTSSLGSMGSMITTPTILGAPAYMWGDAALSSAFAGHGINEAIETGEITPETALEVAPLAQLVPNLAISSSRALNKGINTINKNVVKPVKKYLTAEERARNLRTKVHIMEDDFANISMQGLYRDDKMRKYPFLLKDLERVNEIDKNNDLIIKVLMGGKGIPENVITRYRLKPRVHMSKAEKGEIRTLSRQVPKETLLEETSLFPYGNENFARYLSKNADKKSMSRLNISKDDFALDSGKLFITKKGDIGFNPTQAVSIGDIKIVDAATGKSRMFNLSQKGLTQSKTSTYVYPSTTPIKETEASAVYPQAPKEYIDAVQKNIDYVVNEAVPGSKVFGSSANVAKGNLYHDASDIDLLMPESVASKHPEFKNWKSESPDTYSYYHPTAGKLDVNILKNDANGNAVGSRAHELYAQLHPKEYKALMDKYIAKGKQPSVDLPLDKSSEELFKNYDPVTKSIADAFGSGKDKHMKRAIYLLHYGKTSDVKKGFEMYANYLTGGDYKASSLPLEAFKEPAKNGEIIDALGLKAINKEQFVNDPERMKLLFDYGYFHEGFLGRGVYAADVKNLYPSLTEWLPEGRGGTAAGVGLNTVLGGNSGYGNVYGTLIPEKLGIEFTTKDPIELLETRRALFGRRNLSEKEIKTIDRIAKKYNIPNMDNVDSFARMLRNTSGENGKKYKDFLAEIEKEFGIPAIQREQGYLYEGSPYVSLTKDISSNEVKQIIPEKLDRPTSSFKRDMAASNYEYNASIESINNFIKDLPYSRKRRLLKQSSKISEEPTIRELLDRRFKRQKDTRNQLNEQVKDKAFKLYETSAARKLKLQRKQLKIDTRKDYIKLGGKVMSVGAGGALMYYLWQKGSKVPMKTLAKKKEDKRTNRLNIPLGEGKEE